MQRFTELRVWQRSHQLALRVYQLTRAFPKEELFGLVAQTRRAAVSVPSNIAEGSKRRGRADYARFLNIAEGSLAETETLVRLSRDLALTETSRADDLIAECDEISRMLHALRTAVVKSRRQVTPRA
jgi:four helix bundle protein